jgi:hypothetical protein
MSSLSGFNNCLLKKDKGSGVSIQEAPKTDASAYKQKLAKAATWTDDDLKVFEESRKAFESLKSQQW